jgi:hypothetical protein
VTEPDDGIVAALQLLAGDMNEIALYRTMRSAFGDRLNIVMPGTSGTLNDRATRAMGILKDMQVQFENPPLGKLACESLHRETQGALSMVSAIHTLLTHPKR